MMHIIIIITMAIQSERIFYSVLERVNFFHRDIIPVKGTMEELREAVYGEKVVPADQLALN